MMSVMVTENGGMTIEEARKLRPQDIMERLGGLPARKVHCSVLGDKALRAAINDFYRRVGKTDKIEIEQGRIIDTVLKVTDHDIEEAVLDGADTLEKVQAKTKVGTGDPSCIPEVENLIRFYKDKYFGAS
jgi:bacterioferritin-associated ferredoxin